MMPQKRHMLPLFSGLTLVLAFAVHRRSWRGPRPTTWLCGSFSGQTKPGSQSLTHRKPVRTTEVSLDRSASWQAEVHRLLHLVVGDEEGAAAVQWGTQGEMAVQLRRRLHRPSAAPARRANPKPHFVSDQHRKPRMVVLPREFVRRRSRGCSALRRVWMDVFAVLTLVSVSTRRSPLTNSHSPARLCPSSR